MTDLNEQIAKLIREATGPARREGYGNGYADGWRAALAAVQRAVGTVTAATIVIPDRSGALQMRPKPPLGRKGRPPSKATALVASVIVQHPGGIGGAEIARTLESDGIPERTVRTCLRRLRLAGEIKKRGERWVPAVFREEPENANGEASGQPPH